MIKRDIRYVIKKILIGVGIILVMSFIKSCNVHAETIDFSRDSAYWKSYPQQTNNSFYLNINQTMPTNNSLTNFDITTSFVSSPIYAGSYLIDFYLISDELITGLNSCKGLVTDFRVFDSSTNQWLVNTTYSSSSCIDSYYTTYEGKPAYHILVQWVLNNPNSAQDLLGTKGRFMLSNGQYGLTYFKDYTYTFKFNIGSLQTYDPSIISDFRKTAQNDKTNSLIEQQITNDNQNTQTIINNDTQNTQQIINNQEQNTQDIINNQNQNTQQEIESQQVCERIDKNNIEITGHYLDSQGIEVAYGDDWGITNYIKIDSNTKIKVLQTHTVNNNGTVTSCFYNINKTKISCTYQGIYNIGDFIIIPNNAEYVRFNIRSSTNKPQLEICKNGNQALSDSINDTNDTLKDNTIEDPSGDFADFQNMLATNGVITELITLPISLFTNILNSINGTCSPFILGELMGTNLTIPCINISDYLGSFLWNVIDILFSGFFVYSVSKRMIKVFENMTSLKESDDLE